MRIALLPLLLLCVGLMAPAGWLQAAPAPPPLVLTDTTQAHSLGPHLAWLPDMRPKAEVMRQATTLAQAQGDSLAGRFVPNGGETPGYTDGDRVYWLRCQVRSQARPDVAWLLVWPNNSDVAEVTLVDANGHQRRYSPPVGRDWLHPRAVSARANNLLLHLKPGQTYTIYIQMWGGRLPFSIQERTSYLQTNREGDIGAALYFGLLLGLAVYNLLLFFAVRDRAYLYYVLFVSSFGLLQLNMMSYLTNESAERWAMTPVSLFVLLLSTTLVLGVLTVRVFLETARPPAPRGLDRLLLGLLPVAVLPVAAFLGVQYLELSDAWTIAYKLAPVTVGVGLLVAGVWQLLRGHRPARYYLAGWTLLIAATTLYYLGDMGLITKNFLTVNGVRMASAAEAILLSLGLADRINRARQERQAAQEATMLALSEKEEVQRRANAALRQRADELQAAYADLRQSLETTDRLQEIDELKTRFFTGISHELRTPLTLILGPLEQLMEEPAAAPLAAQHQLMQRQGQRLLGLINQLLDIARLEAGQVQLQACPTDLVTFCQGLLTSFGALAAAKKVQLRAELPSHLLLWADRDQLEKVLTNLLGNSLKFTDEGGVIMLRLAAEAEAACLTVADTGCGIAAQHLPHVFDRFYQADGTTRRRHDGSGIGLALVKELMALHRGTVAVQSEPGRGTTFTLRLPLGTAHLRAEEMVPEPRPNPEAGTDARHTATPTAMLPEAAMGSVAQLASGNPDGVDTNDQPLILVVDDHADMRAYITGCLGPAFRVLEAADGAAALSLATTNVPDLILTDLMMPGLDGLELCRRFKTDECSSHIPVVMLTARASDESRLEGLELGADDYLTKPFRPQELRVRVQNLLRQRQVLRERYGHEIMLLPRAISILPADEVFLNKVLAVVETNLADPDFSVETFASALALSRVQLFRKLKALTDQSPTDFVRTLRLRRAADLLAQQAGNVAETAYAVGFNNLSYFSKCFREQCGHAPSEHFAQTATPSNKTSAPSHT